MDFSRPFINFMHRHGTCQLPTRACQRNNPLTLFGLAEIKILSQRQYERWIDLYLDPFEVCAQREGHSVAISKFGSFEPGRRTTALGELVIFDAWRSHLKVLDCTR